MMVAKLVLLILGVVVGVDGHGRLLRPAGRSSIWRLREFASSKPRVNRQDAALNCGAIPQVDDPGTKCGVCGDRFTARAPKANEVGGRYDQGIITGLYQSGQIIESVVQVVVGHQGHWEWRICTNSSQETQECFNRHVLQAADGSGTRLPARGVGTHIIRLKLPHNVTCERCTLQLHHRAGDRTGSCGNGTRALGCGSQVNYRGCADITIL